MSAKQKILQGHGPSNINLASLFAPLMFAGLHNQSSLLTMTKINITVEHLPDHTAMLLQLSWKF